VIGRTVVGLDDIQREAASVLHTGSAKDRAKRARSAPLLPDHLADVGRSNFESEHSCVLIEDDLDLDGSGIINQGLGDLNNERAYLGDRVCRFKCFCHHSTSKARTGVFIAKGHLLLWEEGPGGECDYDELRPGSRKILFFRRGPGKNRSPPSLGGAASEEVYVKARASPEVFGLYFGNIPAYVGFGIRITLGG